MVNPQTLTLCRALRVSDPHSILLGEQSSSPVQFPFPQEPANADEVNVSLYEAADDTFVSLNPDEIAVDLEDDGCSSGCSPAHSLDSIPGGDTPRTSSQDEQDTSGVLSTELSEMEDTASDSEFKPLACSSEVCLIPHSSETSVTQKDSLGSKNNSLEICLLAGKSIQTSTEGDSESQKEAGVPESSPKRGSSDGKSEERSVKKFRRRNAAIYQAQDEDSS